MTVAVLRPSFGRLTAHFMPPPWPLVYLLVAVLTLIALAFSTLRLMHVRHFSSPGRRIEWYEPSDKRVDRPAVLGGDHRIVRAAEALDAFYHRARPGGLGLGSLLGRLADAQGAVHDPRTHEQREAHPAANKSRPRTPLWRNRLRERRVCILPNLLSYYRGSVIVFDCKGDLAEVASRRRAARGRGSFGSRRSRPARIA